MIAALPLSLLKPPISHAGYNVFHDVWAFSLEDASWRLVKNESNMSGLGRATPSFAQLPGPLHLVNTSGEAVTVHGSGLLVFGGVSTNFSTPTVEDMLLLLDLDTMVWHKVTR